MDPRRVEALRAYRDVRGHQHFSERLLTRGHLENEGA
jgi:hypothetical protein